VSKALKRREQDAPADGAASGLNYEHRRAHSVQALVERGRVPAVSPRVVRQRQRLFLQARLSQQAAQKQRLALVAFNSSV